ncbi:hypothetical protein EUGRSUZ_E04302 [Eucalyptus grandis]|uniref:Uncharacterized protein n=2 Tax=Eucalyptus grandis TaxID=71139 RepID=A0A059CAQ7_EUCGR|nr:hypothetical protein EUGRSUZ_E04302 [Eucalyptus grandis]
MPPDGQRQTREAVVVGLREEGGDGSVRFRAREQKRVVAEIREREREKRREKRATNDLCGHKQRINRERERERREECF